jgi:hypothetical protein
MLSILSFLEYKVIAKRLQNEWLRAKTNIKWRQGCQTSLVFSYFVGPNKESVLFSKSSFSTSYIRYYKLSGDNLKKDAYKLPTNAKPLYMRDMNNCRF